MQLNMICNFGLYRFYMILNVGIYMGFYVGIDMTTNVAVVMLRMSQETTNVLSQKIGCLVFPDNMFF